MRGQRVWECRVTKDILDRNSKHNNIPHYKVPSIPIGFKIHEEEWQGKDVSLSQLKVFSCISYVHVRDVDEQVWSESKEVHFHWLSPRDWIVEETTRVTPVVQVRRFNGVISLLTCYLLLQITCWLMMESLCVITRHCRWTMHLNGS